jgi:flagellar biosynthesis/type III secretory pathway protein FliH
MAQATELSSRLEEIAEEIADLAHAKLREAIETGSAAAAAEERRLGRARRAVLKAAALLGGGPLEP